MKFPLTNVIDVDLNVYVIFRHKRSGLVAVTKEEKERIYRLIYDYDDIVDVPRNNTVKAIQLQYNADKKVYDIQSSITQDFEVSELDYIFIRYL